MIFAHTGRCLVLLNINVTIPMIAVTIKIKPTQKSQYVKYASKILSAANTIIDTPASITPNPLTPIPFEFSFLGIKANKIPKKIVGTAITSRIPALARDKNKIAINMGDIPFLYFFLLYYTTIYIKKQVLKKLAIKNKSMI